MTINKIDINKIKYLNYQCDDMSVTNSNKKKYSINDEGDKDDDNFGFIQIEYLKNPFMYVTTPKMKCLFGIQKKSNYNFQMNLQFTNLEEDKYMKSFHKFIESIEFMTMKYLNLTEKDSDRFISQIQYDKNNKYEPNLLVKLPFTYNKFNTEIYSDHSPAVNILNINKFQDMECDIHIDKIWKMNNKFYMKWKVKIIHLM